MSHRVEQVERRQGCASVTELTPRRQSTLSLSELIERRRNLPPVDPGRLRSDVDELLDMSMSEADEISGVAADRPIATPRSMVAFPVDITHPLR